VEQMQKQHKPSADRERPSDIGIITTAFGSRKFIEMAADLALSVKKVSAIPVSVVTDQAGLLYLQKYQEIFDQIFVDPVLDDKKNENVFTLAKVTSIRNSPYSRTVFLDSDVIMQKNPTALFNLSDENSIVVMGRLHDRKSIGEIKHHGILVKELLRELDLHFYVHCFLCCFVFDKLGGKRLLAAMEDGLEKYNEIAALDGKGINDELLLGLVGSCLNLSFFPAVKPYQTQDSGFRWGEPNLFIHSAPMRIKEVLRTMWQIIRTRHRYKMPKLPSIFWLNELLERRAVVEGRSRILHNVSQSLVDRIYRG
jgi:hypothetical protein